MSSTWIDLGLLNDVLFQFEEAAGGWVVALEGVALSTFYALGVLELAWTGIRATLQSQTQGLATFYETLVRKVIFLGFVMWLIGAAPALLPMVVGSFQKAGAVASGVDRLHPSSFLATGVSIADSYLDLLNLSGLLLDPLGAMMGAAGALLTVLLFSVMAGVMLLTLIESYLAIAATPFLLAMAGSRWTARIAEGALAYVVRTGVKLFVLYLVAGVAHGLTLVWASRINSELVGPVSYLGFLGSAYALAMVVWSVPRTAANMVPPTLTFGLSPSVGDN